MPIVVRGVAQVLETERRLAIGPAHHELRLGVLEDEPDMPGELARAVVARVEAGGGHPPAQLAAVEVRHEAERRPQQRRLARARAADQQHELTGVDAQVDAVQGRRRGAGVAVGDALEAQRSHRTIPAAAAISAASAAAPATAAGLQRVAQRVVVAVRRRAGRERQRRRAPVATAPTATSAQSRRPGGRSGARVRPGPP